MCSYSSVATLLSPVAFVRGCFYAECQVALQVIWLDVIAARARYGRWIGGTLPTFVPVPLAGKASAKARKGNVVGNSGQSGVGSGEEQEYSIRLKQLRCSNVCVVSLQLLVNGNNMAAK